MWLIPLCIAIILVFCYCALILVYYRWLIQLQYFKPDSPLQPQKNFTIVIPARNEEDNIEQCLISILENDYPANLFEVIVVDDFSTDNTARIVQKLRQQFANLKLIHLEKFVSNKLNSYKKKSIETAIIHSANDWIVTTDADCKASPKWLSLFNSYIQRNNIVFIAAPVKFINNGSFLSIFQCLDFISLQGITAASVSAGFHNMCNGANLAYKKEAFYAVNGFEDVDNIASGDDMLLMHKIEQRYPGKIGYLFNKEAIVETLPMPDWKSFIDQRTRWASKAASYNDKKIFLVLLLVYLTNLCLFLLPFLSFLNIQILFYWLILLLVKTSCELVFMLPITKFFGQQKLLLWFVIMQPFHIAYTVVSGWLGKFGKYEWKGRIVK
jgi:cellulose synthase/poly-beta-1,6-N-acetylglucosamine synthase-like glycosyltransferase